MTELLQQAIMGISKLSDEKQDVVASRLLAKLKDAQAWQSNFAVTTDAQWDSLAYGVVHIQCFPVQPIPRWCDLHRCDQL